MLIRDYYVPIPPHLFDLLQDIGGTTSEDFDTVIAAARAGFFNFSYPVPQADKEAFETFVLNRFILRRLGSGNTRKWRQMFKAKLLEIMPYYARLMESEHITFDPLINNDITTTDDGSGTLDTTRDNETNADGSYNKSGTESAQNTELNRYSDTPQGDSSRIWEVDAQGHARLTDYYVTDVRGITNNGSRTWQESGSDSRDTTIHETIGTDTTHTNENYKIGVAGSSKSKLVNEYRETFLRIYSAIAAELEPLFYNLVEIYDILDFV